MDDLLSEAEAWRKIADRIERGLWREHGLCWEVDDLEEEGEIDDDTADDMRRKIRKEMAEVHGHEDVDTRPLYIWPCGFAEPRIKAALAFAEEVERAA